MHFVNELKFTKLIGREWEDKFAKKGAKIGDSVRLRKPLNFVIRDGKAVQLQDIEDRVTTLTVNEQVGVDFAISSDEFSLDIDRFSERYLQPAMRRLANEVDLRNAALYKDVPNFVGTPGTTPNALSTYGDAKAKQTSLGVPEDSRNFVLDPFQEIAIIDALKGLVEKGSSIAKQYQTGKMAHAIGYDWHASNNVRKHTVGALGGTPTVTGAGQTGANIVTGAWTAAAAPRLKRGDIVTFAGVNAVNPITGEDTGQLRQFVVTADVSSDGAGAATIPIFPSIITSGAYKTVTASPANAAAILIFGHASNHASKVTAQGLGFYPDAFTCAIVGLEKPNGTHMASYKSDEEAQVSIRFVCDYEVRTDLYICRFDVLLGRLTQNPDFAVRIVG